MKPWLFAYQRFLGDLLVAILSKMSIKLPIFGQQK